MRRYRILTALSLVLLPPLLRGLWYYRGVYQPAQPIELPKFSEIQVQPPPLTDPTLRDAELKPGRIRTVLVDLEHENRYQVAEIEALTAEIDRQGGRIEIAGSSFDFDAPSLADRLKYADAYLVIAPLAPFSDAQIQDVVEFLARGGRLLVVLDPTRSGGGVDSFGFLVIASRDLSAANPLLEPLDLAFSDDYLYDLVRNEGNFRNIYLEEFGDHQVSEGLEQVVLYASRSVTTRTGHPLLRVSESTLSSRTDMAGAWSAAALSPDGNALALGDLTFMTPPYDSVASNAELIRNLAAFLLGGERVPSLRDIPYIFSRPVEVLTSPVFAVQAETLSSLSALEGALAAIGLPMSLTPEPTDGADLIVLALYEPEAETDPHVDLLGLTLPIDQAEGLLEVPGFGALDPTGIGVVGLHRSETRNTLVILAEDRESLSELAESVLFGSLGDCVIQGRLALCKTGEGAGFDAGGSFDFDFEFEETVPAESTENP